MKANQKIELPDVSPVLLRLFYLYCRRYIRRGFHGVRVANPELLRKAPAPSIIYCNHPSWWDPLICLVLAQRLFSGQTHYAPIDSEQLERYKFFARLGFFGLEKGTYRGAVRFLKTSREILKKPGAVLWLTPEGQFRDPRQRPARISPGLGHLAVNMKKGVIIPLALEYPFWDERHPEALIGVGERLEGGKFSGIEPADATGILARKLEETQDRLAALARRRDPKSFETVLGGAAGVGGIYDLWRRLKARLAGEEFQPEHRPEKE